MCHSVTGNLQASTEARLGPGVEYKQLSMYTLTIYSIVQLSPNLVAHLLFKNAIFCPGLILSLTLNIPVSVL